MSNTHQQDQWEVFLSILKRSISEQEFRTWFSAVQFVSYESHVLRIGVPNRFLTEYIEEHFLKEMTSAIEQAFGVGTSLQYTIITSPDDENQPQRPAAHPEPKLPPLDSNLNQNFTFDNFVEGQSNKLARTVALSIAEHPGKTFNPFFLYGPSGVGKTHLISAVGHKLLKLYPDKRVLYVPAHLFKTQFIDSVRNNTQNDFIHFYQTIDVLIIDDIQEFTTTKTQQAFFHIFNHLQLNGRQIIISSDREPAKFEGIEERMLTRFRAGMMAPIERPDLALRRAILQTKIRRDGLKFPKEVVDFIVTHVDSSVRDLEGIISSIMAYSIVDFCGEITLPLAERIVSQAINLAKKELSLNTITRHVCTYFGVKEKEVISKTRKQGIVQARQISMYLSHKYTDLSYAEIGRQMGKKDHSTVLHSCSMVKRRLSTEKNFRHQVEEIEAGFKN